MKRKLLWISDNKAKREKMVKGSFGNTPRKRLADISNFQEKKSKPTTQVEKPMTIPPTTKEYIEHLHQENMALAKLLADRKYPLPLLFDFFGNCVLHVGMKVSCKIIEVTGIELQKLRISLQKLQQQNLQLAQANSQMLAELNSGKDRLRVLHHELGCKNSILQVRNSELEEKAKKKTYKKTGNQVGTIKCEEAGESLQEDKSDDKPCTTKRRQSKNQSIVSPSSSKQVQEKDKAENKKLQSRRQSTRFISVKSEPTEDLFEIDDAKFPASQLHDDPMHDNCPTSLGSSGKKANGDGALGVATPEFRRSSIGRPLRRAAEKVQSYKEIPINVKMRRSE
ncbi:SHUGOSHIN 2 [Vitis vinifera]|uniref:SHUGOSHIN 2 n=1 Tax=Vitis vinifera TaxID=29760 RepID=A0A438DU48_VITVI|nr:SHUGOSHIN 2 [Vitis vinifera]